MILVSSWSTKATVPVSIRCRTSCSIHPEEIKSSSWSVMETSGNGRDALGGQYGCLYIDEINTADIDFVREASMRCDYLMATLNPDDPSPGCVQRIYQLQQTSSGMGEQTRRRKLKTS